ncbi:MAG TPA: DUF268 domain-containing protein [Candidatus Paceibacterota bacterium]|nr:DUF268 domain-containing protein [Candidatus Paceibacterota bacterium]
MTSRSALKRIPAFKWAVMLLRALQGKRGIGTTLGEFSAFVSDWRAYRKLPQNPSFALSTEDLYPRLFDKTATTGVDPVYFYQDAWLAKKIFGVKPARHTDVGSHLPTIGIISQFVPTTMVDIRPPAVTLSELSFVKGNILALPFRDGEIPSLSSICVIEHIGLGRYGDPLDPFGSEKAVNELVRVLAPSGNLYISVPIDSENKVYFNAHRAFTRDYVLELFKSISLIEERYIYRNDLSDSYDATKGFGTGLYHFKK